MQPAPIKGNYIGKMTPAHDPKQDMQYIGYIGICRFYTGKYTKHIIKKYTYKKHVKIV